MQVTDKGSVTREANPGPVCYFEMDRYMYVKSRLFLNSLNNPTNHGHLSKLLTMQNQTIFCTHALVVFGREETEYKVESEKTRWGLVLNESD
jgi:hypothetical protein